MKAEFIGNQGVSIIEAIIAGAVLTMGIAAVLILVSTDRQILLDSGFLRTAFGIGTQILENSSANAETNFSHVQTAAFINGIYSTDMHVVDVSPCRKQTQITTHWVAEQIHLQHTTLQAELTAPGEALHLGYDCGFIGLPTTYDLLANSGFDFGPNNRVTDIDALGNIAVLSFTSPIATDTDIAIVRTTDPAHPAVVSTLNTGPGIADIDVIKTATGDYYIFAAQSGTSSQLAVIEILKDHMDSPHLVTTRSLPGVAGSFPGGKSIFYSNKKIYIGTKRTAGHELHIYDVSDPKNPVWIASKEMNHNLNKMAVRDGIVYIAASGNLKDLMILDAGNPASTTILSTLDLAGDEDAKSLFLLGNRLAVGRVKSTKSHPELNIVDVSDPASPLQIASSTVGAAVNSIALTGSKLFLATDDSSRELQIWNYSDSGQPTRISGFNLSGPAMSIDGEGSTVYVGVSAVDPLTILKFH